MPITKNINFKKIAEESGLSQAEADQFNEGIRGNHQETLNLQREPYTKLQKKFELALLTVISANIHRVFPTHHDQLRPPFVYKTPKLCTPVHNPDHPRAHNVEMMIHAPYPMAAFISNFETLTETAKLPHLDNPDNQERLNKLLTKVPATMDPFSFNDSQQKSDNSYMATRPINGVVAVQFEATQMPNLENPTAGKINFGEQALSAYEVGIIHHHINRILGNTSEMIRRVMEENYPKQL